MLMSKLCRVFGQLGTNQSQEAAATYALHREDLHYLSIGDTFVVCDAGGGTVDLISYTVTKLDPSLEVKEAAPGNGALCGSTYLDRRFQEYVTSRLGHLEGWDDETLTDAMKSFEQVCYGPLYQVIQIP